MTIEATKDALEYVWGVVITILWAMVHWATLLMTFLIWLDDNPEMGWATSYPVFVLVMYMHRRSSHDERELARFKRTIARSDP